MANVANPATVNRSPSPALTAFGRTPPVSLASIIAPTTAARNHSDAFYVDMSSNNHHHQPRPTSVRGAIEPSAVDSPAHNSSDERNRMFSMFIDFAEPSIRSADGSSSAMPSAVVRKHYRNDDDDDTVQLRVKPPAGDQPCVGGRWTIGAFEQTPSANLASAVQQPTLIVASHNPEPDVDSCSASVVSADQGYQSMPMPSLLQLSKNSRSRSSMRSCGASTVNGDSTGSSREDVARPATLAGRMASAHDQQTVLRPLAGHSNASEDGDRRRYSKDSIESLCRRESSFSDAEEAAGVVRTLSAGEQPNGGRSSVHSSYGDLRPDQQLQPTGHRHPHALRKNNSLSQVGEQQLMQLRGTSKLLPALGHHDGHTMESLQATMERQQKLLQLETVNEETPLASFVKLSDMDERRQQRQQRSPDEPSSMSRSAGGGGVSAAVARPTSGDRASNGRSTGSMSRSMGTNLSNLASTEDTLRSLTRLFPHLSDELALSPTADFSATAAAANGPPPVIASADYVLSDLSAVSSLTSSYSRSGGIDSADEWSLSGRPARRLGEDLLKMFLQEIATDCQLDVAGRTIRAHQCILRSRCQYFAAMLAGGGAAADDSQLRRIQLAGYSFGSVHFALCHIYSGAAHPPQGISLFELAALADLLALEGLKEVTAHALRAHYCHNFHKPCTGCIDGIMRVFPVTLQHGLDDLYQKCLRWTCKHYVTVWSTRAFALLPADLIERCVQYVVAHVNSETVLTLLLNCDNLVTMLSSCRWAIGVENTVRDLIDTGRAYVADHFANLLASDCFLSLGQDQSANIGRLENLLLRTASTLTPEQASRSYQRAHRLNAALRAKCQQQQRQSASDSSASTSSASSPDDEFHASSTWNAEFLRLVEAIERSVEHCLVRQCGRAMRTQQWQRMELELRKRIQELACLTDSADSKRSSKNYAYESTLAANPLGKHSQHGTDMNEVKMAIESLSKRSKDGRFAQHNGLTDRSKTLAAVAHSVKVTKLRKPNAMPHLVNGRDNAARPHSMHSTSKPTSAVPPKAEPAVRSTAGRSTIAARLFKHSVSVDDSLMPTVTVAHRPPSNAAQRRAPAAAPTTTVVRSASSAARFAEIRPRYLEPKKLSAQSVDNLTRASNTGLNRTHPVGPASTGRPKAVQPHGTSNRSINSLGLSRDSLVPAKPKQYRSQTIMSQDSLASRRSQPQRSMSRDSLAKSASMSRLRRDVPSIGERRLTTPASSSTTTNGTATTSRSSRLSTGYQNSPRDSNASSGSAQRTGRAPLAAAAGVPLRQSFVSAKSREILAKRNALNRTESLRLDAAAAASRAPIALNKSHSTSNIPLARRTTVAPGQTTLHLRRTARLPTLDAVVVAGENAPANRKAAQTAVNTHIRTMDIERRQRTQKLLAGDRAATAVTKPEPLLGRMERSQTFSKDDSDLDVSTLVQIE